MIGDSFIEGLQVNVADNASAVLESRLKADAACASYPNIEVDSYGMSGAPMSQYLSMLRYAARMYPADVYIVNIVDNDFDESWAKAHARESFMHYTLTADGQINEVAPVQTGEGSTLRRTAVQSALFRYLYFNLQVTQVLSNLTSGNQNAPAASSSAAEDDIVAPYRFRDPNSPEHKAVPELVKLILTDMKSTVDGSHAQLLITMDADRLSLTNGRPATDRHT